MKVTLEAKNLDVGYEHGAVVSGINVTALRGRLICLLGPNGAGKSTILHTLSGSLAPRGGAVYICGQRLAKMHGDEKAKRLSVVLTERPNVPLLSVFSLIAMGRAPHTGFWGRLTEADYEAVREAIATVGIEGLAGRNFMDLSDGERQKALIARALAQGPELIILDEPTSHLDISSRIEIMEILARLTREKGTTIVMSLHDIDIALKVCHEVITVRDGSVLSHGTPEEILRDEGIIERLYGIKNASYDALLGNIELKAEGAPRLFVAAGAGSGVPIYRALARAGAAFAAGIFEESDVDCRVARSMGAAVFSAPPYSPIGDGIRAAALAELKRTGIAVAAPFPVGPHNRATVEILREFLLGGGVMISAMEAADSSVLFPEGGKIFRARSTADAVRIFESLENDKGASK